MDEQAQVRQAMALLRAMKPKFRDRLLKDPDKDATNTEASLLLAGVVALSLDDLTAAELQAMVLALASTPIPGESLYLVSSAVATGVALGITIHARRLAKGVANGTVSMHQKPQYLPEWEVKFDRL